MPNGSTGLLLADSNLLVYAVDSEELDKSIVANELIDAIDASGRGITNSQVLIEFYAATTRARGSKPPILRIAEAQHWIERLLSMLDFRPISGSIFREAVRGSKDHQMNIFDAQIWAAAKLSGATFVLTEDMQGTELIEGVRYLNPFDPSFKFAQLGLERPE